MAEENYQQQEIIQFEPGNKFKGWTINEKIRENIFGAVYKVSNENGEYALKVENVTDGFSILKLEMRVLNTLTKAGARHVCKIEELGDMDTFLYAVTTLVGPSLNVLRNQAPKHRFTIGTAISVGIQCLEAIEDLHRLGYLFRDVQPSKFTIGRRECNEHRRVYVFDLSMAKKYVPDNGTRSNPSYCARFNPHIRYAPFACHQNEKLHFIDEVESWFYMLVEWTLGGLPWTGCDVEQTRKWKKRCRNALFYDKLLFGCPWEYVEIFRLIKDSVDFDKPEYNKIYVLLIKALTKSKKVQFPYDWEVWEAKKQRKEEERKLKEEKKNRKLGSSKSVTKTWTFGWVWTLPEKKVKEYETLPDKFLESNIANFGKDFKYCFKIYPKGIPNTVYQKGSWLFLNVWNLKKSSNIEAKFTVNIQTANYFKECHHIFKSFGEWESCGVRIDELFNPRKRCFSGGQINISLDGKFVKVKKSAQINESGGNELDYLSFSESRKSPNTSVYSSFKDVYFPPDDAWLIAKCYLIGIQYHENVSKFRPSIDDIQKFTIQKPDDVVTVKGDGHCGYRSLSVLITGKQYYHQKMRRIICSAIIQNRNPNFEDMYIFKNARSNAVGKLQIDTSVDCEERFWMDDADLAAAANLFECNIFVLDALEDWQCYGPKTFENGIMESFVNFDPKLPTLLLQNSGGNHFSPVVNVRTK